MKIKMLKDYLDFEKGKEYEILGPSGDHLVRKQFAKYVTGKDGKEDKSTVETKELKTNPETK